VKKIIVYIKRHYWQFWLLLILALATFLRTFNFNKIPPSLFGDEVDTGYQAYSILKTGKDYFGNRFPVHFQSFGDWRMPLYIYATVPSIAVFGLTNFAVRLPGLIFSLSGIVVTFFLVKEITNNTKIALLASLFLVLSPWHFHFSRIALEVTLFNLLFLTALFFFLKGQHNHRPVILMISGILFALSLYAYSTAKLFIPLFLSFLFLLQGKKLLAKKKMWYFLLPLLLISLPMGFDILFGQGGSRFMNISIITSPNIAERVELARRECSRSGFWPRAIHNKVLFYFDDFVKNYLTSFSTDYLFIRGDPNFRHNPGEKGLLYPLFFPLILVGACAIVINFLRNQDKRLLLPFLILFLTPVPAALTQNGGAHAIRTYQFLPWWEFLAAYGLVGIFTLIKSGRLKKLFVSIFSLALLLSSFSFFHFYFLHFPNKQGSWWRWWNYGYQQTFDYLNQVEDEYRQIYFSPAYDPPIVYALFYNRYSPQTIQKEITISPVGLGKYLFANPDLSFLKTGEKKDGILFVVTPGYTQAMGYSLEGYSSIKIVKEIPYPDGEVAFYIFKTI